VRVKLATPLIKGIPIEDNLPLVADIEIKSLSEEEVKGIPEELIFETVKVDVDIPSAGMLDELTDIDNTPYKFFTIAPPEKNQLEEPNLTLLGTSTIVQDAVVLS
jgi:hypothetical protein